MRRAERRRAAREGTAPRTLLRIDYLLLVNDETRQGALRFTDLVGGPFLQPPESAMQIPRLIDLPKLLAATSSHAFSRPPSTKTTAQPRSIWRSKSRLISD